MKYSQAKQGRIFVIRLEDGDIIHQEIEKFAREKSIKAGNQSQQVITEAQSYAENTLSETTGMASEILAQARAYRTLVVENARARAEYLQELLPEYRKRPKLVLQKIYQDAIEDVLTNVQEILILQVDTQTI